MHTCNEHNQDDRVLSSKFYNGFALYPLLIKTLGFLKSNPFWLQIPLLAKQL